MTRILGMILALALAAVLVPQGSSPVEASKKKAAKLKANTQPKKMFHDLSKLTGSIRGESRRKGLKSK